MFKLRVAALHMHASALAHSKGHFVSEGAAGTAAGSAKSNERGKSKGRGFVEAVRLQEYVGHVLPMIS